ncbi:hypothetical protein HYH03_008510 [Edaphochlamys debaryana]|uniref:F-box domain-containing protein n=1 Tax=Edaphochlamys debaryana TaxID=47281 RepID=A0A836BZG2_9CHLO|nr:hypothetical protein HYH03_008510 [Edaphochlamys debaryana]|eukprot:KAG2493378.1 hypothetical protein HYH03_008510 [Edaphochlamys debaryana]
MAASSSSTAEPADVAWADEEGPHPAILLPEVISAVSRHLRHEDLDCASRVCRLWRGALGGGVRWLSLPARARSEAPLPASLERAVQAFGSSSGVVVRASAHATPCQPPSQSRQPEDAGPRAQAPDGGLAVLLQRATAVVMVLEPAGDGSRPAIGGRAPGAEARADGVDLVACLAAPAGGDGGRALGQPQRPGPEQRHGALAAQPEDEDQESSTRVEEEGQQPHESSRSALAGVRWLRVQGGGTGSAWGPPPGSEWRGLRSSSLSNTDAGPGLDLPATAALSHLQHLRHLSCAIRVGSTDRVSAWAQALARLPSGLTSLRLLGPLCHCPDIAEVVRGWAAALPELRDLDLAAAECSHPHPDLEGAAYEDPAGWTSECWQGVFPALTQLRSLQLSMDAVSPGLWSDLASLGGLSRLRLRQASWGGLSEAPLAPLAASHASGLRDLTLALGDSCELGELAKLTHLTRLDLELLGLAPYETHDTALDPSYDMPGSRGLLALVTRGLRGLRHLRLCCRHAGVDPSELAWLRGACPRLTALQLHAPLRVPRRSAPSAAWALPSELEELDLSNAGADPHSSGVVGGAGGAGGVQDVVVLRLAALPPTLARLWLEGVVVEMGAPAGACPGLATHAGPELGCGGGAAELEGGGLARTTDVRLARCEVRCGLLRLCGLALRSLDVSSCMLLGESLGPSGGGGPGGIPKLPTASASSGPQASAGAAAGGFWAFQELRALRLWGCRGQLRALSDSDLASLPTGLQWLAVSAASTSAEGLAALSRLERLRGLQLGLAGQACAAALGQALVGCGALERLEVVLPGAGGGMGFVVDCVRDHLARSLGRGVAVRLQTQA